RASMRNAVDTVVISTLGGAALSLGMSIVIQRGAFADVRTVDPAHTAFIALNLGFLQPIIFGTAAAVSVMALRRKGSNTFIGLGKGLVLVLLYELGTTLLNPHGIKGIVFIAVIGWILAAAGLLLTRGEMHTALLAEAQGSVSGATTLPHAPEV